MATGRTGAEIIKSWFQPKKAMVPIEKQYHNPLQAKIGSHARLVNVVVGDENFTDELWKVTEIWAWTRIINGKKHPFADYILTSEEKQVLLRVMPQQTREKEEIEIIIMRQFYPEDTQGPLAWCEESPFILGAVMDHTGEFIRFVGEPTEEKYFRDLSNIKCEVAILRDQDGNGTVEAEEVVQKLPFSFWTFRRDTIDEANQAYTQHLHVQLSGHFHPSAKNNNISGGDKDILMLRGEILQPTSLMMY